jgi:hypothetical protein
MKDQRAKRRGRKDSQWNAFGASNYRLFLAGAIVIVLGYICMMQGPHDSFLSLHLAPVLLVLGYCVLIPVAILRRPKGVKGD